MEKLNKKTKGEQLFLLTLMFAAILGIFCITGCGGKSCETPKCASEEYYGADVLGCSIPGCGGCLTSERGCNTACWPQACKYVSATQEEEDEETGEKGILKIRACDTRYYGDGCLGCNQTEKSCYSGCAKLKNEEQNLKGIFFGSSESEEYFIGCYNGCGGCIGTDDEMADWMYQFEDATGVY